MKELQAFISYRRDDGLALAKRIFAALEGRHLQVPHVSGPISVRLSLYMDVHSPAVPDWEADIFEELAQSSVYLVVCSCGAKRDFGSDDILYKELRWWLENRSSVAPILLSSVGHKWVPDPIQKDWPKAEVIDVPSADSERANSEYWVDRVLARIATDLTGKASGLSPVGLVNHVGLYVWAKDRHFKYIECNEAYAQMAGFDSPDAMIGKSDDDMPWASLADLFRSGDNLIITGKGPPRQNVVETEIMIDRVADILVSENQLRLKSGKCVGVQGCFVDITNCKLLRRTGPRLDENGECSLGELFGHQKLSGVEVAVLKRIILEWSVDRIAADMSEQADKIEAIVSALKHKLQCSTEGDVLVAAVSAGLPFVLFGPDVIPDGDEG